MGISDNAYGQQELQAQLLDMVKEIDAVCRRHDIHYTLFAGSMLGAVREKGFIPWDDDFDLVFTREELERFLAVFPTECKRYAISLTDSWVARVVTREPLHGEIPFVDLFHYDWLPQGSFQRKRKLLTLRLLQGMLKHDIDLRHYSLPHRVLLVATHILGLPFTGVQKLRWYDQTARIGSPDDGQYHVSTDQFRGLGIPYDPKCATSYHDAPFEDAVLKISDECDAMLTAKYGADYMTPPPENKRVPGHEGQRAKKAADESMKVDSNL